MREERQEIVDLLRENGFERVSFRNVIKTTSLPGDLKIKVDFRSDDHQPEEALITLAEHFREDYDGHVRLKATNSGTVARLNVFEGQHDDLDRSELRGEVSSRER